MFVPKGLLQGLLEAPTRSHLLHILKHSDTMVAEVISMTRRTKGDGGVSDLGNDKFRVTFTIGTQVIDGKKKQIRKTAVVKGRQAAIRKLKEFQKEQDEGKLVVPEASPMTVQELADKFLEAKQRVIRGSTYRYYDMTMRLNVVPYIGGYLVTDITPDLVDELVARWISDTKMNMASIKTQRAILKALFKMAVDRDIITKNPVTSSSRVRVPFKDMKVLSQEEAKRLLGYAKRHCPPMYLLIKLALATGMRRGELLGLCWDCVLDSSIRVWRNLIQTKEGPKIEEPKTTAGRRTIAVASDIIEAVRGLQGNGDFVFRWNGWADNTTFSRVSDAWRECLKGAGIEGVRFHDLRHTHATQLITRGVDIKTVSKRLGHESIKTTLDLYAHWLPERDQEAAEMMAAWIRGV